MTLSRPEGVLEKSSKDCCSVWAWRKSGIKILVTPRGLLFFSLFSSFSKRGRFWPLFQLLGTTFCHFLALPQLFPRPNRRFTRFPTILPPFIHCGTSNLENHSGKVKKWPGFWKKRPGLGKSDPVSEKVTRIRKKWVESENGDPKSEESDAESENRQLFSNFPTFPLGFRKFIPFPETGVTFWLILTRKVEKVGFIKVKTRPFEFPTFPDFTFGKRINWKSGLGESELM